MLAIVPQVRHTFLVAGIALMAIAIRAFMVILGNNRTIPVTA